MALITPSSLQYVVGLSLASRLLIFSIQILADNLIPDHRAVAYRNRYHEYLASNHSATISDTYRYSYSFIKGFTKWDSQYFIEISNDGYTSEQHLAFLPLFPLTISLVRQFLFDHRPINLDYLFSTAKSSLDFGSLANTNIEDYIRSAVVGFALNNFIFFPIACLSLFILTKLLMKGNEKYARDVIWWFCFNPASVFFSACYTESIFAAITFTAMLVIEYRALRFEQDYDPTQEVKPLNQINRLLYICFPSLALLALSSAARSNGLLMIGFVLYQFLLKYINIARSDRSRWKWPSYLLFKLDIFQDSLVVTMLSLIAASGFITFQVYSYIRFCLQENRPVKGQLDLRPDWCDNVLPQAYGYVQAKYWNVGPFKYYRLKQTPNFLLALPMAYLTIVGSAKKVRSLMRSDEGRKYLVYYLHALGLMTFCLISINVQVSTRMIASSCPAVYWICADAAAKSRSRGRAILTYFLTYFIVGTLLHTNFYPWT